MVGLLDWALHSSTDSYVWSAVCCLGHGPYILALGGNVLVNFISSREGPVYEGQSKAGMRKLKNTTLQMAAPYLASNAMHLHP